MERDVRHVVWNVEEEGPLLVALYEFYRALGVPSCELRLIRHHLHDFFVLEEWQRRIIRTRGGMGRPHVVRVGKPEPFVEAVARGQKLRRVAEMPLSVDGRGVAASLQNFGE